MKQLNEEKSINIQRLEYIRDKECLPQIFRKGNAKKFEITKDGTEDVIKVTTTSDKDYTIYPNMTIASNTSGEVRTFTCTGIENVGEQSNNDNDDNDDNGGNDNSPTTNWKSNFVLHVLTVKVVYRQPEREVCVRM